MPDYQTSTGKNVQGIIEDDENPLSVEVETFFAAAVINSTIEYAHLLIYFRFFPTYRAFCFVSFHIILLLF